jgi:hypothetical protein
VLCVYSQEGGGNNFGGCSKVGPGEGVNRSCRWRILSRDIDIRGVTVTVSSTGIRGIVLVLKEGDTPDIR